MASDKKKNRLFISVISIIYFILVLLVMSQFGFQDSADDAAYKTSLSSYPSLLSWCKAYYNGWSGRVIIHVVLMALLNSNVWIWRIIVSLSSTLLIVYALRIAALFVDDASTTTVRWKVLTVLSFIASLHLWYLFFGTLTWCTGSANYLLPGCCLIMTLFPFISLFMDKPINKTDVILAILPGIYMSSMEQTGAVFVVFTSLIYLYRRFVLKKHSHFNSIFVLWLVIAVLSIFSIAAPGNRNRAVQELFWFNAYHMFSLPDKVILGLQQLYGYMYRYDKCLLIVLLYVLLIITDRSDRKKLGFALVGVFFNVVAAFFINFIFSEWYINGAWTIYLCWVIFAIFVQIYNSWLIYISLRHISATAGCIGGLLYLAAIACSVVIGVSPSIYASGYRGFFICQLIMYMLVILVAASVFVSIGLPLHSSGKQPVQNKKAVISLLSAFVLCIVFAILLKYSDKNISSGNITLTKQPRNEIELSDVEIERHHGYIDVRMTAKDTSCKTQYSNWVNGTGSCGYLNAKMIISDGKNIYQMYSYPIDYEDNLKGGYKLRGYLEQSIVKTDNNNLKVGLVTYDLNGNLLGYNFSQ